MTNPDTQTVSRHTRTDSTFRKEEVSGLVEREAQAIADLTRMWLMVGTKSGRPTLGPSWIAIVYCPSCNHITLTTSKRPKAGRWHCRNELVDGTCTSIVKPILVNGPKAYQEHADYLASLNR